MGACRVIHWRAPSIGLGSHREGLTGDRHTVLLLPAPFPFG
jgi:hypothetical protein